MPNSKGFREAAGQGNWSARHWPAGHPKALDRNGRLAVRLWVYRRAVAAPDGRSVTVQGTGKTKAVATANFARKVAQLEAGARALIGGVAVTADTPYRDWFPLWLASLPRAGASTRATYERNGNRYVVPALGHVPLGRLTAQHVEQFLAQRRDAGLAPATIALLRAIVRASLKAAHDKLPKDVLPDARTFSAVEPIRVTRLVKPTYAREQAARIVRLARAAGDRTWVLGLVGFATGGRLGELLGLQVPDREADLLTFRRKVVQGGGARGDVRLEPWLKGNLPGKVVPLTPEEVALLEEWETALALERIAWERDGRVWDARGFLVCREGGRPHTHESARDAWRLAVARAGLPYLPPHDAFRHTRNEWLREAGVDPRTRSDLLGHSVQVNEGVYTRERLDLKRQAAITVGGWLTD